MRYNKKNTLKKYVESKYEYTTPVYVGVSFAIGCAFYTTDNPFFYLTDYDTSSDKDLEPEGLFMLYYRRQNFNKHLVVSLSMIFDSEFMEVTTNNFLIECENEYKQLNK